MVLHASLWHAYRYLYQAQSSDHTRLVSITADRNSPQKHVWRAQIVLPSAQGLGTTEIMRATGKAKTCVWRWRQRFMEETAAERVVALTLTEPPGEVTHWTAAAIAAACTISFSSMHRIWRG